MGVGPTMVFGVVVVGAFLGGFGAWSAFAPLQSAAIAQGVVSVSGKRKTVRHLEGGIVAGILVKEGGVVAAGQELVVLEDTRARAAFSLLRAQFRSAAALKARLEAERDGLADMRWPAWLSEAVAEDAGDDVIATQARIFRARARSLDNRTAIHRRQIEQLRAEATGLEEEIETQDRQLALLEEEIAAPLHCRARWCGCRPTAWLTCEPARRTTRRASCSMRSSRGSRTSSSSPACRPR